MNELEQLLADLYPTDNGDYIVTKGMVEEIYNAGKNSAVDKVLVGCEKNAWVLEGYEDMVVYLTDIKEVLETARTQEVT